MTHPELHPADLTLDALEAAAARLLARAPGALEDERVSAAPDARTLRYYQSLGLMDKPSRYDGRQAIYGRRHLLQAVCVKLLQRAGRSLQQAQAALAGATDEALESAVIDGLGLESPSPRQAPLATPDPFAPLPEPVARPLVSAQLAPGVFVMIDPSLVSDPAAMIRRLTGACR
ncbi:MerR family transcriptional regulator [Myxococcota bacterium]|nr:MerR family transcriptional regulator [Myxococcota bacterium]